MCYGKKCSLAAQKEDIENTPYQLDMAKLYEFCTSEAGTIDLLFTIADLHDIVNYNYKSSFRFSSVI